MSFLSVWSKFALLILVFSASAFAKERWTDFAEPVFRTIGMEQGLLNPAVTALAEDASGFLWIGTQGGLARWDGYRFHNYRPDQDHAGSLPDAWITVLCTDRDGVLWIGTTAGGLARYDRDHDRFTVYGAGPKGLSNVSVTALADDGRGGLWIGTDNGLDHLDPLTRQITRLNHASADSTSLPDDHIAALLRDSSGTLWVGSKAGLARRRNGGSSFEAVPLGTASSVATAVTCLFESADRRIWVGTARHGAFVTGETALNPRPAVAVGQSDPMLSGELVFAIGAGGGGDIWLGTYGEGIVAIDETNGQSHRIRHQRQLPKSLPSDTIYALHKDRSGGVWVASQGGLSRLQSSDGTVTTIFGGGTDPRGLSDTDVESVLATRSGLIWLGLVNAGIDIVDPEHGRIATVAPSLGQTGATPSDTRIITLAEAPDATIFIGTYHGVFHADSDGRHISRVTIPGRDPTSRSYALWLTGKRLWVGGGGDGLWSLVPGDIAAPVDHFDTDALTDRRITTLKSGMSGDLWVGTRHGLNRLSIASRVVEHILPDRSNPNALPASYVSTLLFDRAGRLWVGTFGGGIAVMVGRDGGKPIFHIISIAQGLPDQSVDTLLMDSTGRIWVSTDNGIAVIDPGDFTMHALQAADGLAMPSYWAHSGAVTTQGELLFGGTNGGLTVIRPDRYQPSDYQPPIVVDEVRVGGATVPSNRFNAVSAAATLEIAPDDYSLAVDFSALDYAAPESNRYAYRLKGFDRHWIETDATRRVASYTNLAPGRYTLLIRGTNRNGRWSSMTAALPIRVLPAWYQTWLFDAVAALMMGAGVLGLVQLRTRYLAQRKRELEAVVAARTAELHERKREIEQLAYYDALTGLPNRRIFADQISAMLTMAAQTNRHFALLLVDLDHFKAINDTLGHDAGDALLVEAAVRLATAIGACDVVARLGGDEFAILLGDLPGDPFARKERVDAFCARIIDGFVGMIALNGIDIKTSASIGVAAWPEDGSSQSALCKAADRALYEAKSSGKSTWRWYEGTRALKDIVAPTSEGRIGRYSK